jgi:hypothetical protein
MSNFLVVEIFQTLTGALGAEAGVKTRDDHHLDRLRQAH